MSDRKREPGEAAIDRRIGNPELEAALTEKQDARQYDWIIILLLGLIALYVGWVCRSFVQDDAFITYRYAKNIANGHGFVYNLHEPPVLGTTTPLYTLWLALLQRLSGQDIRLTSHWISIFCLWAGGVLLYYLGKNGGALLAAAVSLVFISNPLLAFTLGMETGFLNFILLLALASYVKGKFNLTGVLLGLLVLTRYETILFAGILATHFLITRKQIPFWSVITAGLFLTWAVFAWRTFGSVIPQSVSAKLVAERGCPFALGAVMCWGIYVAQTAWYSLFLPLVMLGSYVAIRSKTGEQASIFILIWSIVYFIGASLVAGSFPWYYGPLIPGFAILVVWGIEFLVKLSSSLLSYLHLTEHLVQVLQTSILITLTLSLTGLELSSWPKVGEIHRGQVVDARYVIYREVAEWLNHRASDDESLATAEIGVLGYYTDMKIIDLYGLVTPSLTPWSAQDLRDTLRQAIELHAPDYVLIKQFLVEPLEEFPEYEPVPKIGRDDGLILYERTER